MNTYKGVDFSYPSSPNAVRFGYAKTGCWTITVYTQDIDGNLVSQQPKSAHPDQDSAFAAAAQMVEPWGGVWKRYRRHAIAKAEGITADEVYPRPKQGDHYE